ncbi:ty3-gypsy retrotransposon protein, partial [Tanacetum coccineum]
VIPKVGETNALLKPVTSNSAPSTRESKVMKNDNVIAPGMFRINPSKTSRVDNVMPNKPVKASVRTKLITTSQPHEDISVDFITEMSLSKGFTVVLVVVDRFLMYAHFAPLPTSFNAHKVAKIFVETIIKLHGIPKTIVSDRDPIFVSKFWTQLFKLSGTYHISIKMTPYQALYGKVPLAIIPYPPGSLKVAVVDDILIERDRLLRQLRQNLLAAKSRIEEKANLKHQDVEFNVEDQVLVKLERYRQLTLAKRLSNKLAKRYYRPYKVFERVGKVAYCLAVPVDSKIHPVFHISILKPFLGNGSEGVSRLPEETEGRPIKQPIAICGSRFVIQKGRSTRFYWLSHSEIVDIEKVAIHSSLRSPNNKNALIESNASALEDLTL